MDKLTIQIGLVKSLYLKKLLTKEEMDIIIKELQNGNEK
jgi:hypothetical protein